MINTGVNNFNSPMRLSKQTLRRLFLLLFNCDNFHKSNWSGFHSEKGAHAAFVSPCDTGSVTLLETLLLRVRRPRVSTALEGFSNQSIRYSVVENA